MQHDLKVIAKNHHFNPKEFIAYAKKHASYRYPLFKVGTMYTITTSKTDRLINDFTEFKETNRFLMDDDIVGFTHRGWTSQIEGSHSGCIVWTKKKSPHIIYATPNWDKDGDTPFTLVREGNEHGGDNVLILTLSKDHSLDKQKKIYLAALDTVIESI
jgi:hypothetical protein